MENYPQTPDDWVPRDLSPDGVHQAFLEHATILGLVAACVLVFTLAWIRIFTRTGYHGAMGMLMLVPGLNVFMLLLLAFGRWPIERKLKLKALRRP